MKKTTMNDYPFLIRTGTPYWGVRLGAQLVGPGSVGMLVGSSGKGMEFLTKLRIMRALCADVDKYDPLNF